MRGNLYDVCTYIRERCILIESLQIPYNAQFYRLKDNQTPLPNIAIANILREACKNRQGDYLAGHEYTRVENNYADIHYKYTLRVYRSKRNVPFIDSSSDVQAVDIIHAYILILEFDDNVVIFKKSTSTFTSALTRYLELLPHELILHVIDHENSKIQRLSLRNMIISGAAIHSHSYETPSDLKGLISPHAMGKAIPKSIRFKEDNTTKSVTASTGRILESSAKSGIEDLLIWAQKQIYKISLGTNNYFIDRFARPVKLEDVLRITRPRALLIEVNTLRDALENDEFELGMELRGRFRKLNNQLLEKITSALEETFEIIVGYDIKLKIEVMGIFHFGNKGAKEVGRLKINEKSLTFGLQILNKIAVKQENEHISSLLQYVISNKLYSIVFDDIQYMYFMGQCFKDVSGTAEIDSILQILIPKAEMVSVATEKGSITATTTAFDPTSMFAVVEGMHSDDDYIFCDDLGNEWCDHITINIHEKTINFIHSKAKDISLSASNMHDVVSQGIKNLGNMFFTSEDFIQTKQSKFGQLYSTSNIQRVRQGDLADEDIEIIKSIINDHKTHRQCILSCSFLSKSEIETEFDKLKNGDPVRGNIVQLVWILSSFIHACRGMHVVPVIYCRA